MVQAWSCFSGSRWAQGNALVSSGLGSRQWRFLPDQSADPRVCGWGEEVLMLRRCLHLTVQSADCTTLCRAGRDLGACFVTVLSEHCLWCRYTKSLAPWRGRPETPEVMQRPTGFHHKYQQWREWCPVTPLSYMSLHKNDLVWKSFHQFMQEPIYFLFRQYQVFHVTWKGQMDSSWKGAQAWCQWTDETE